MWEHGNDIELSLKNVTGDVISQNRQRMSSVPECTAEGSIEDSACLKQKSQETEPSQVPEQSIKHIGAGLSITSPKKVDDSSTSPAFQSPKALQSRDENNRSRAMSPTPHRFGAASPGYNEGDLATCSNLLMSPPRTARANHARSPTIRENSLLQSPTSGNKFGNAARFVKRKRNCMDEVGPGKYEVPANVRHCLKKGDAVKMYSFPKEKKICFTEKVKRAFQETSPGNYLG
jgi:hypothetical protein